MRDIQHHELCSSPKEQAPLLSHWHVREVARDGCTIYEVRDSRGAVVAADIKCLEHARLFALSPLVFENFQLLEQEAVRALACSHTCDVFLLR